MQDMQGFTSFGGMRSRLLGATTRKLTTGVLGIYSHGPFVSSTGALIIPGYQGTSGQPAFARSSDGGNTWSLSTGVNGPSGWDGVAQGNGRLVSVANNNTISAYSANDGVTWSQGSMPGTTYNWYGICFDAVHSKFVAVGGAPGNRAAYSADGASWTQSTMPATIGWYDVAALPSGRVVACGYLTSAPYTTNIYATSDDGGASWTQRTLPVSMTCSRMKTINGRVWMCGGSNGAPFYMLSTADGVNWDVYTLPSTFNPFDFDLGDGLWAFSTTQTTGMPLLVTTDMKAFYSVPGVVDAATSGGVSYAQGRFIQPAYSTTSVTTVCITG